MEARGPQPGIQNLPERRRMVLRIPGSRSQREKAKEKGRLGKVARGKERARNPTIIGSPGTCPCGGHGPRVHRKVKEKTKAKTKEKRQARAKGKERTGANPGKGKAKDPAVENRNETEEED